MIQKITTNSHEEWLELRSKYIGGSDAAAVVGLNPWCSPYSLWAEKTKRLPAFEGNLATEVGSYLEDFIAKKFETITGKKVRKHNQSILNSKYPFAIANIDRDIVSEDAGLECKSTSALNTRKFKGGEFPDNYYCQCVHYLGVTEKKRWYIGVLIGNFDFKIYQLTRIENDAIPEWCESSVYINDAEIEALMGAEQTFWKYVEEDTPPAVDGTESTTETITTLYNESSEDSVNLMAYTGDLERYIALTEQIKELENQKNEAANKIKAFMQDSDKGWTDGFKVSWPTTSRTTFDSKRFVAEHPEMDFSEYYKTSTSRTFKVSKSKK